MGDNDNRNILPAIWGHNVWSSINNYIAILPDELSKKQTEDIMCFFNSLTSLLPCSTCKLSYILFSKETDTNIYNINNFKTRNSIIFLVWKLREKVNKKLDVEYGVTLNYYTLKLNYSICDNDNKNLSGVVSNIIDAPFIHDNIMDNVLMYLKKNSNFDIEKTIKLVKTLKMFIKDITKNDFDLNNDRFLLLIKRSNKCLKYNERINKHKILNDFNEEQSFNYDKESYIKLFSLGCTYLTREETLSLIKG
jgi:hypothetical protein